MNPASHGSLRTDTLPYFAGRYFSDKNRIRQDVSSDTAPVLHGIRNSRSIPPDTVRGGLLISRNARDTAGTTPPAACGTSSFRHIPQNTGQCLTGHFRNKRDDTAGSASASVPLTSGQYHCLKQDISSCETRDSNAHKTSRSTRLSKPPCQKPKRTVPDGI